MPEHSQTPKTTQLFVKLVNRDDFDAAWESASVLAKLGIQLVIFANPKLMHQWLASTRLIRDLSVRVLQDLEGANV